MLSLSMNANSIQALVIIVLLLALLGVLAVTRRHFLEWSIKGPGFGLILGFLLALVIEGLFLTGKSTILNQLLSWKNAPKPVSIAIEEARLKFAENICTQ